MSSNPIGPEGFGVIAFDHLAVRLPEEARIVEWPAPKDITETEATLLIAPFTLHELAETEQDRSTQNMSPDLVEVFSGLTMLQYAYWCRRQSLATGRALEEMGAPATEIERYVHD